MKNPQSTTQTTAAILIGLGVLCVFKGYAVRTEISKAQVLMMLDRTFLSLLASLVPYFVARARDYEMGSASAVIGVYLGMFIHLYAGLASAVVFLAVILYRRYRNSN